jgi:hypothetical protein
MDEPPEPSAKETLDATDTSKHGQRMDLERGWPRHSPSIGADRTRPVTAAGPARSTTLPSVRGRASDASHRSRRREPFADERLRVMTNYVPSAAPTFDLMRMDRQIRTRVAGRRVAKLAAWSGLVVAGLRRGGGWGWLATGCGLYGFVAELLDWRESAPEWQKGSPHHGVVQRLFGKARTDLVDEASSHSFPASDSPSHDIH